MPSRFFLRTMTGTDRARQSFVLASVRRRASLELTSTKRARLLELGGAMARARERYVREYWAPRYAMATVGSAHRLVEDKRRAGWISADLSAHQNKVALETALGIVRGSWQSARGRARALVLKNTKLERADRDYLLRILDDPALLQRCLDRALSMLPPDYRGPPVGVSKRDSRGFCCAVRAPFHESRARSGSTSTRISIESSCGPTTVISAVPGSRLPRWRRGDESRFPFGDRKSQPLQPEPGGWKAGRIYGSTSARRSSLQPCGECLDALRDMRSLASTSATARLSSRAQVHPRMPSAMGTTKRVGPASPTRLLNVIASANACARSSDPSEQSTRRKREELGVATSGPSEYSAGRSGRGVNFVMRQTAHSTSSLRVIVWLESFMKLSASRRFGYVASPIGVLLAGFGVSFASAFNTKPSSTVLGFRSSLRPTRVRPALAAGSRLRRTAAGNGFYASTADTLAQQTRWRPPTCFGGEVIRHSRGWSHLVRSAKSSMHAGDRRGVDAPGAQTNRRRR